MAETARRESSEPEWYVITDDDDVTIRITTGLAVGEDAQGELQLNGSEADDCWLAFRIGDHDELWLEAVHESYLMRIDGANELVRHELEPGSVVCLPHNRLHISATLRRDASDGPRIDVLPVTAQLLADQSILTSESDLPILYEATGTTSAHDPIAAPASPEPIGRRAEGRDPAGPSREEIELTTPGPGWRSPFSTEEMAQALGGNQRRETALYPELPAANETRQFSLDIPRVPEPPERLRTGDAGSHHRRVGPPATR